MSEEKKENHLVPCSELDTCKMCERFCNNILEKLDQKSDYIPRPGDRVVSIRRPKDVGTLMSIPNDKIAWVKFDYSPQGLETGISLKELEFYVEQKPTGSVKKDDNKYDPTMLTIEMVELVSKVRMFGAKKYARGNFKITGFKYTRSLAAALRHIFAFLNGEDNDPESGLSHLGHAICSLEHCIYDTKNHPENDDRKS